MDNVEKPFTIMEWCAGYGGIGMGLKRVIRNLRTIAYSEIELFGCEILASRMEAGQIDAAPIWTNLKTFPCERFRGMVDLLVAGYPCQPFSTAGKRQGEEDPRHLWPFIERAISDVRPNWVFCENVAGHLTLGFKDVCHDLDELHYEVAAGLFTAREVGLPHKRQRLFILAHDKSAGTGLDERRLRRQFDEADGPNEILRSLADPDRDESSEGRRPDAEVPGLSRNQGEELGPALSGGDGAGFGVGLADSASRRGEGDETRRIAEPENAQSCGHRIDLAPAGPGSEQYWWEPARVLANDHSAVRHGNERPEGESGNLPAGSGQGVLADPENPDGERREGESAQMQSGGRGRPSEPQIIKPLGGSPDGPPDRLDGPDLLAAYQSLGSRVHSRVDELRALGNGVIPAVSAKAFITLYDELTDGKEATK